MQLNATDDGQKSVTFGVNEVVSLLDSQVKCVPVQCVTVGRRLLESLLYGRLLQILSRCFEQLHIVVFSKITYFLWSFLKQPTLQKAIHVIMLWFVISMDRVIYWRFLMENILPLLVWAMNNYWARWLELLPQQKSLHSRCDLKKEHLQHKNTKIKFCII